MSSRPRLSSGWSPALLAAYGTVHAFAPGPALLKATVGQPFGWLWGMVLGAGLDALLTTALIVWFVVASRRWSRDLRGMAHYWVSAGFGALLALGLLFCAGSLTAVGLLDRGHEALLDPTGGYLSLPGAPAGGFITNLQALLARNGLLVPFLVGSVLVLVGWLGQVAAAIRAWFDIPARVRAVFWSTFDVTLLTALGTLLLLPMLGEGWMILLVSLGALRLAFRLIPYLLDLVEEPGFMPKVAARMLRAGRSGGLGTIGLLSLLAVAFSVMTLTVVLSVMGGFRNDLKVKILGNNAHVVVDREDGSFEGWGPTLDAVRGAPGVVAATPYVNGEVMITSATNLAGAVIRGIDPDSISDVTLLEQNIQHGRLDYLAHPERLLDLTPEEMGRSLLAPSIRVLEDDDAEPPTVEEIVDDVAEMARAAEGAAEVTAEELTEAAEERARIEEDLAQFLQPEEPEALPEVELPDDDGPLVFGGPELLDLDPGADPSRGDPSRPVLPGLIVGQELARTLRLNLGDEVNVVSPLGDLGPAGPMPKSRPFRIAGIFYSGMYEYDMKVAYTSLEAGQQFLSAGGAIDGIEVRVTDVEAAEQVAGAVRQHIDRDDLRVRAWQEVNRNLFGALALEKLAMFITLGIAILVASFCVVGTLTLMVQEKRQEVGILRAMGATEGQVVAVFLLQGLMIGLLGASIGLGLGFNVCYVAEHFGIALSPDVYYIDRLPVHIDPVELLLVWVSAVTVCLLATIYPAILGGRLRPLDALRDA